MVLDTGRILDMYN